MSTISVDAVRDFVVEYLDESLQRMGIEAAEVSDGFDIYAAGLIDSLGLLELITAVEEHFGLDIDFEALDPEGLTMVGPFSHYVASQSSASNA
jgi:acyl carrier protein